MCKAISIIMSEDSWWGPSHDGWNHSHSSIAEAAKLPGRMIGDKYARVEVTPPDDKWRADDGSVRVDVDTWNVVLDEAREPGWWTDDKPAQIDRAKRYAAKWLAAHPSNLVPGHSAVGGDDVTLTGGDRATLTGGDRATLTGGDRATLTGGDGATLAGGDRATLTGGDRATLTGGNYATLTGGNHATLTGGDDATLTGGNYATLTGGNYATLTGGNYATLTGGDRATLLFRVWDVCRFRFHVAYIGEAGIEANKPYVFDGSKVVPK